MSNTHPLVTNLLDFHSNWVCRTTSFENSSIFINVYKL